MPNAGVATTQGTAAYAARLAGRVASGHFRSWGGLTLSSIGLGTYLGREDDATDTLYRGSIRRALELGCNVLDSAINYRCQRSERIMGEVLTQAMADGVVRRDEIVVSTKGGYVPFDGSPPADARAYFREAYLEPGIVRAEELVGGCHVMTPRYLEDQLQRSRRNLALETVDIYYLHNPEQQLEEVDREEFGRRVRAAFELLETKAEAGEIRLYGTATWNGYRQEPRAATYLSLEALMRMAREVGGPQHRFRAIQLPFNLAMCEAYAHRNQSVAGKTMSLLDAARHFDMIVMASASIYQGHLARGLPALLGGVFGGLRTDAQRAIQFVRSTPGVAVPLVGMREIAHVEENLALARMPPAPPESVGSLFERPTGAAG